MEKTFQKSKPLLFLKTAKNADEFVGIKITSQERTVTFPVGFVPKENCVELDGLKKDLRNQILLLIRTISNCKKLKSGEVAFEYNGKTKSSIPIKPMLFIIEDFFERSSYYTERENFFERGTSKKISWNKTIKNIKPQAQKEGVVFLDFVVRKNRIKENQIVTELHKFFVFKSFELLGFLFSKSAPEKGALSEEDIQKQKNFFAAILQEKIEKTHLEKNALLFENMLFLLCNCDFDSELKSVAYGTTCFQTVWEFLVDAAFGNIDFQKKEKYFFPRTKYSKKKFRNAPLRPDTIMILGDKKNECYILDSKYYAYENFLQGDANENCESRSFPGSASIQKQIVYAEFVDNSIKNNREQNRPKKFRFEPNKIFNIFVLPGANKNHFEYIDCATSEWKDNSKNYHYIHAISLDTEFLLLNGKKPNAALQSELAKLILKNQIAPHA